MYNENKQPAKLKNNGINFNAGLNKWASQKTLFDNQKEVALDQNPDPGDKTISLKTKPEEILKNDNNRRGMYIMTGASWQWSK